jgi:D-glycero-D-manno-heptose 1,7-bisphosphate phosphatase
MLLAAARDLGIDLGRSVLFGDKLSDLEAAHAAGIPVRVLLGTDARERPSLSRVAPGLADSAYAGLIDAVAHRWPPERRLAGETSQR